MIRMALRSFNIQIYCLLGVMLLGWLMTPFRAQFVGISIGLLVSMYCAWILGRRIEKFGNSIVKRKSTDAWHDESVCVPQYLAQLLCMKLNTVSTCGHLLGNYGWVFLVIINLGYYSMRDAEE